MSLKRVTSTTPTGRHVSTRSLWSSVPRHTRIGGEQRDGRHREADLTDTDHPGPDGDHAEAWTATQIDTSVAHPALMYDYFLGGYPL
jgi:hypothetical protein